MPLRGYAVVYGQRQKPLNAGGRPLVYKAGSYRATARNKSLMFCHDPAFCCATTGRDTLRLWEDETGLAFEADPKGETGRWLMGRIAAREFDAVSIWLEAGGQVGVEIIDGVECDVITAFSVGEISITNDGADPRAVTWLAGTDRNELPIRARHLAAHWESGRQQINPNQAPRRGNSPNARGGVFSGALAPSRVAMPKKHKVPESVIALMASEQWAHASHRHVERQSAQSVPKSVAALLALGRVSKGAVIGHAMPDVFAQGRR